MSPQSHNFPLRYSYDLDKPSVAPTQLTRRHTDHENFSPPLTPSRTMTAPPTPLPYVRPDDDIDMDLAYGPIPPPLPVARPDEELELKGLINKVKALLIEADCLQASATATISSLQKNPDAMAAVALTLAEISNVVSKMAPGAVLAMKGSAPAVFALLASPQFLIAGGVAVGVTVVCLGGYKIIKKIKAKKEAMEEEGQMDEMLEIGGDVSRIDTWRRGIAEAESMSLGTSVDGEFITPTAAAMSGVEVGEKVKKGKGEKKKRVKKDKEGSEKGSEKSEKKRREKKVKEKEKKPSSLRLMFMPAN